VTALRVAVVGAGAIGAGLDRPGTPEPLSHAGGVAASGLTLCALVDTHPSVNELAVQWSCAAYSNFDAMMQAQKPDIVTLAVTTEVRAALLLRALAYRPKVVIAEKPLTSAMKDAEESVFAYRAAGVPLIVNYSRRFVPTWQSLRGISAVSCVIKYAKGVRHNGTHAIDLCRMLFGELLHVQPLASKADFWKEDPTVSAFLSFERCPEVFLQGLDERNQTLFEVDIIGAGFRFVVDMDGRRLRRFELQSSVGVPPGVRLVEVGSENTGAGFAMLNLLRHAVEVANGAQPLCSGEDALAAQAIAQQLLP
jgi:predicted dehydrogenase